MEVTATSIAKCHGEVLDALSDLAATTNVAHGRGDRVQADRKSQYQYLGLRTPDRRKRVAAGFSFTAEPTEALETWNGIWNLTDNGDVLFAALDFYRTARPDDTQRFWDTVVGWVARIDNCAHADDLGRIYSFALEATPDLVYPVLEGWSQGESVWHKRVSIVSLIHYSGKNAVFLPATPMLRLVANCVADDRDSIYKAVGWVLREMMTIYPSEVAEFLAVHAADMHPFAIRRATDRLPTAERDRLRSSLFGSS